MHVRDGRRLLAAVMLVCAFSAAAQQQNSMRVDFRDDKDRVAVVGIFRHGDLLYASANDLASVLGLTAKESASPSSLELSALRSKIKLAPANPFIIITDDARKQSIVQLPVDVMYAARSYFVPLRSFLEAAASWLPSKVDYESRTNTLHVGAARSTPYDITRVEMESKANGMVIRIPAAPQFTDVEHWIRQDGWLYVTIAGAKADVAALGRTEPEGLVRKVVAIQSTGSVQLSFKLRSTPEAAELSRDPDNGDILFTLRTSGVVKPLETTSEPVRKNLEEKRDRWALDVIVIDHGYGLMSLYGHLSSMSVAEGQKVARGDVIGQTGETGLAGGDQCVLVHGRAPPDIVENGPLFHCGKAGGVEEVTRFRAVWQNVDHMIGFV